MTKLIETFTFDAENLGETRDMIVALGGQKLPGLIETWVADTFTDDGKKTITFFRKSGETGFQASVYMKG
jgi:hypothetical protein